MAKVYDVPADVLIDRLADILKSEEIKNPEWTSFVKTGSHADRPPQDPNWWYTRCASILRKIYLNGPISVNDLRATYGSGKPLSYGAAHHRRSGGAIIRTAMHELERLGYVKIVEKKGRMVSAQGMRKLDKLATEILSEMIQQTPRLKIYS